MANSLDKNFSTIVLKGFLPGFMSDLVLAKSVNRELLQGKINPNTGSTVQFKRPHQYTAERTSGGDVSGSTKNQFTSATATGEVGDYITVRVEYSQLEEAIELNELEGILQPVRDEMVTSLESEISDRMIAAAALVSGTPGTAITKWSDVAKGGSLLKAIGVKGQTWAALDPFSTENLADAQGALASGSDNLVNKAWEDAQISGNFGGLRAMMTNGLSNYTSGTQAGVAGVTVENTPVVTYSALKDSYEITVDLENLGGVLTLKVGDIVEFDDTFLLNQQTKSVMVRNGTSVPFTGTVTADVTAVAGKVTVVLSGAPIFDTANEQYDTVSRAITAADTVTVLGTAGAIVQPSMFYTKGAFGLGTVELPKLHSIDSAVVNHEGFSIRVHKYADGDKNTQMVRFDILPSFCVFNPFMMGKMYGNP